MGTRNLIIVYLDGVARVAQYCQWDGYPEGQGRKVLEFLYQVDLQDFAAAVGNCRFISDEELNDCWKKCGADDSEFVNMAVSEIFKAEYPHLHRDTGAGVLDIIQARGGCELRNNLDFIKNGLFCEWAWVIDLDANLFEAYEGCFTGEPVGRFAELEFKDEYKVTRVGSWPLDNLPDWSNFLYHFEGEKEEA